MAEIGSVERRHVAVGAALTLVGLAVGLAFGGVARHSEPAELDAHAGHDHDDAFTCSMHPQVHAQEPGSCPICGMELVSIDSSPGLAVDQVGLSERGRRLARVETVAVHATSPSSMPVQLLGRIDYDETRRKTVTAWIGGRIDKLNVSTTGQKIRVGQRIAALYSPEVYATHQDLLQAARHLKSLERGSELARKAARASLESVRERLRLLGVSDSELARMEQADSPSRQVPIRSPFSGTVIERLVDEGMYVSAGTGLYRLAELSRLWVQLDAYESDLPHIQVGDAVALSVDALPGKEFEGRVSFIEPTLDTRTRTTRVRVEVLNREGLLRPGMFAQALVATRANGDSNSAPVLTIPDSAPLFTGRRSLVFVERPAGDGDSMAIYEAREVELGPRTGKVYPVLAGLRAGELVVARGAFALDADLQIRGGASMMARPDDPTRAAGAPAVDDVGELPEAVRGPLAAVVDRYLGVQRALAGDQLAAAVAAAGPLAAALGDVADALPAHLQGPWESIGPRFRAATAALARSKDLATARRAFESASEQLGVLLRVFGNPGDVAIQRAYCPMAFGNRGASWFQAGDVVDNSYEGLAMRSCGSITESVPAGGFLDKTVPEPASPGGAGGHAH